jgi:VanZ family protein
MSGDLGSGTHTKRLLKWLLFWLPFLPEIEKTHGYLRKAGHVLAYGSLSWLWFRAFSGRFHSRLRLVIFWSLALCLVTAVADEAHQSQFASRGGSILDVALDFGAAAVAALALSFKRI